MPETTITSRKFGRDTRAAKKAADKGPVVITEKGRPAHVLLSYSEYRLLTKGGPSLAELLFMPEGQDIDFDPPKLDLKLNIPDLS